MKNKLLILYILGIAIVTAAAFLPTLSNQFVDWDDPAYVTENESVQVLTADNVKQFFTRSYVASYCPLVMLSYAAEYSIFGPNPFVYHLTNYLLNICVALLVFGFVYMLSHNHKVAFITALVFGVHPVHVESVAWVAERKDLLCALFYMIAITVYLVYLKDKKIKWYLFCFIAAVLALFSKAMAVTIPLVLMLIDYYRGRKIEKRVFLEKIPFLGVAMAIGLINMHFQKLSGATELMASLEVKLYFLSKVILFYLYKILVPLNLSAIYPYHSVNPTHIAQIKYYFAAVLVLAGLVAVSRRWSKKIIFGSAFFLITVLPVLKIIPVGDAFAADRYMYLPSIGLFYIFAVFVNWILKSEFCRRNARRIGVYTILAVIVASLSGLTWQRCMIWKDSSTLFTDVVSKYPTASIAWNNLGTFSAEKGETDKAIGYFREALLVNPDLDLAQVNIESAYKDRARMASETLTEEESLRMREKDIKEEAMFLNSLGENQGKSGDIDDAITLFKKAARLDPSNADSYNNLGFAYYRKGEVYLAEEYFNKALEIDPDHEKARRNLDFIRKLK